MDIGIRFIGMWLYFNTSQGVSSFSFSIWIFKCFNIMPFISADVSDASPKSFNDLNKLMLIVTFSFEMWKKFKYRADDNVTANFRNKQLIFLKLLE